MYDKRNHLGNVLATITDRRVQVPNTANTLVDHYEADVISAQDYSAFGAILEGRSFGAISPRGFNGQERSLEIDPYGNLNTAEYWEYDSRTGRRWNLDPKPSVGVSEYSTFDGNPVSNNDPNGDCFNCALAAGGAVVGAIIGGAIEAGTQYYQHGKITSWKAVGGAALQGGITGGVAGFTGGASLLVTTSASAAANVIGGAANNAIQGKKITMKSVTTDAAVGAAFGIVGYGLNKFFSPSAVKSIVSGNWVEESTTGWSAAAKEYQEFVTGVKAGKAFEVEGVDGAVRFDGVRGNTLLEAKSSYDNFVKKGTGEFYSWFKGAKSLVSQAERQLKAAKGAPIEWNFSSEKTLNATKLLFEHENITGITLKYTPKPTN